MSKPKGVYARDIITHFIGMVDEDGGKYKSLEWKGSAIKDLSLESGACISNNSNGMWMQALNLRS